LGGFVQLSSIGFFEVRAMKQTAGILIGFGLIVWYLMRQNSQKEQQSNIVLTAGIRG
jgi:hypothetical protein